MYCGKCGNVLQENEKFCPKCGTQRFSKYCGKCGNILQENEKFCPKCGTSAVVVNNCSKCGKLFEENEKFCSKCGNARVQNQVNMNNTMTMNSIPQNQNNNVQVNVKKNNYKQWTKKKVLVSGLAFVSVFLIVFFGLMSTGLFATAKGGSRTIMIYMVGSNLESKSGLATRDLEDLDYSYTSKNGINVLLIAGGSKAWRNDFIDVTETSIYELGPTGFEKVETRSKDNMGSIDNLSYFLNYAHKHYKSKNYDLIFWNHGGAVDGSEYDELTGDNLKVEEMKKSLENSPFKTEKLEVVSFRTCLNATVEIANVFKDYANYLVASEEYTVGSSADSALRFINIIKKSDSAIDYGKKEIEVYEETVYNACYASSMFGSSPEICYGATYSIIDLSKVSELKKAVNDFSNDLDAKIDSNYAQILSIRSKLNQYGGDRAGDYYEMIDLYDLADNMQQLSSNASKVKKLIDEAVVYNWTNTDFSHGISVYFPLRGGNFIGTYDSITVSDNYSKLITKLFNKRKLQNTKALTSFSTMEAKVEKKDKSTTDLEIELTEEQIKNIDKKGVLVFADTHDGLYQPIFNGRVKVEGNKLKANIKEQLIKISDIEYDDKSMWMIMTEEAKADDYVEFKAYPKLVEIESLIDPEEIDATLLIRIDKEHPTGYVKSVTIEKNDDKSTSDNKFMLFSPVAINLKNYRFLKFYNSRYKLIDDNGNFDNSFKSSGYLWIEFFKTTEFKFIKADLEEEDLYAVFRVLDMDGNEYDSKPIKLTK